VVYSNAMQGNGWESAGMNTSGSAAPLNAYAVCATNVSGTVSQVFSQVTVGGGTSGQAVVACPAGAILTGGGYAASAEQQVYSNAVQGNGWESASNNNGGAGDLLNSYAVCYNGTGSSSSFVVKQVTVGAHSNVSAQADCPAGSYATGGGYAAATGVIVFTTMMNGNGWESAATNATAGAQLLNSYAICTHF
jgi:hypothetical protein